MDNPISIEALMEEVNPVYMTAQRCLQIVARLGDKDSIQLCRALGLPELEKSLKGKDKIDGICIDMKNLEYISSAGLRVLLIIRKGIHTGANLSLVNMTEAVREIIETTGFDTIMC